MLLAEGAWLLPQVLDSIVSLLDDPADVARSALTCRRARAVAASAPLRLRLRPRPEGATPREALRGVARSFAGAARKHAADRPASGLPVRIMVVWPSLLLSASEPCGGAASSILDSRAYAWHRPSDTVSARILCWSCNCCKAPAQLRKMRSRGGARWRSTERGARCAGIQELDMCGLPIEDADLACALDALHDLRTLNLNGCKKLSPAVMQLLVAHMLPPGENLPGVWPCRCLRGVVRRYGQGCGGVVWGWCMGGARVTACRKCV